METLATEFFRAGPGACIIAMFLSVISVFDYLRLSFTDRGSVEEIEAREDALIGTAILAGGVIIGALVHIIGVETINSIFGRTAVVVGLSGVRCAAQIIRAGFIFLTSHGRSDRIAKAKSILWRTVWGTAVLAGMLIFIVRKL